MSVPYRDKTFLSLKRHAEKLGLHRYHGVKKDALINALEAMNKGNGILSPFQKKKKIGEDCVKDEQCYSKQCKQDKCVSKNPKNPKEKEKKQPSFKKSPTPEPAPAPKPDPLNCMSYNTLQLQPHQEAVIQFLMNSRQKGLVVQHSTGSGKTITAISTARCLLQQSPDLKVIILTPASVTDQFRSEVERLMLEDVQDPLMMKRFEVYSHVSFLNRFQRGEVDTLGAILVIDEAHNFKSHFKIKEKGIHSVDYNDGVVQKKKTRGPLDSVSPLINVSKLERELSLQKDNTFKITYKPGRGVVLPSKKQYEIQGMRAKMLQLAASRAEKVILLSATPIVNSINDLRNYIAIVHGRSLEDEYRRFTKYVRGMKNNIEQADFSEYLRCAFSYYQTPSESYDFPTVYQHHVMLKMSQEFLRKYTAVENNVLNELDNKQTQLHRTTDIAPFLNGLRRAVNGLDNIGPKREWLSEFIQKEYEQQKKNVIYSTFLEFGTKQIEDVLVERNIPHAFIDGSMPKLQRKMVVDKYNRGDINTLIISAAGSEGLDLKETRNIIIMEPFWNPSRIKQVIGRGARKGSHKRLTVEDRNVHVWHLLLLKPNGDPTADTHLLTMTDTKQVLIDNIYGQIVRTSIETGECP
jgi:SNF2 family DNA or RNA helicase